MHQVLTIMFHTWCVWKLRMCDGCAEPPFLIALCSYTFNLHALDAGVSASLCSWLGCAVFLWSVPMLLHQVPIRTYRSATFSTISTEDSKRRLAAQCNIFLTQCLANSTGISVDHRSMREMSQVALVFFDCIASALRKLPDIASAE